MYAKLVSAVFLTGSVLLLATPPMDALPQHKAVARAGACAARAAAGGDASRPVPHAHIKSVPARPAPEVTLYIRGSGTDVTGVLKHVDASAYVLSVRGSDLSVSRPNYEGLVLNNELEKGIAEKIVTDITVRVAASKYAFEMRKRIREKLAHPADKSCTPKTFPLFHFQINRDGNLQELIRLADSDCPAYNAAALQAIRSARFAALPKDYPFEVFPANFLYEPETASSKNGNHKKTSLKAR